MWPYLKRLIFDEGAFVGAIRSVLGAVGLAVQSPDVTQMVFGTEAPPWAKVLGVGSLGAALLMRSSVKGK